MTDEERTFLLAAVKKASEQWKTAFNSGDAPGCASHYEAEAVMTAEPFGEFRGKETIQAFWQKLIEDGFSDVEYVDPRIDVIDPKSAVLESAWKMNKAKGVIYRELWVLQDDRSVKLREDHFAAL
ncbi:MAG: nuclear transport factor 2 family protein [Verrucomicrobiota bacterium]